MARSIFVVERGDEKDGAPDNCVHFGQKVRITTNSQIMHKPLYLHSVPITPLAYARFSRNQEVSVINQKVYNTIWTFQPVYGNLKERQGEVVMAGEPVMLVHCATSQYLYTDKIDYRNQFGIEYEVSALCAATKSKTQILANEGKGTQVRENVHKTVPQQNYWCIELSSDPATNAPVEVAAPLTAEQIMEDIKGVLKSRGAMAIRGIGRVFRILDDNRNRQVDGKELLWGLKDFGIHLGEGEAKAILAKFDRDGSGAVSFDEFIRCLRGDLSEARLVCIKAAYDKLDVNKDGKVTLDDVAKLYDVSMHPDVVEKRKSPEEAYKEFMSLWETQVIDGIVTFDEFCDYMRDVSCSIDTDEYFEAMMKSAWKL